MNITKEIRRLTLRVNEVEVELMGRRHEFSLRRFGLLENDLAETRGRLRGIASLWLCMPAWMVPFSWWLIDVLNNDLASVDRALTSITQGHPLSLVERSS